MTTTGAIAANLSEKVYQSIQPGDKFSLFQGDSSTRFEVLATKTESASGYFGAIIRDNAAGGKTYLVNRGTTATSPLDWANNANIVMGNVPAQFGGAVALYNERQQGIEIDVVTGHSLGGAIAQLFGIAFGFDVVSTGSPGVGGLLNHLRGLGYSNQVDNYDYDRISENLSIHDPVASHGNHVGSVTYLDFANYIRETTIGRILEEAFNSLSSLIYLNPALNAIRLAIFGKWGVENHSSSLYARCLSNSPTLTPPNYTLDVLASNNKLTFKVQGSNISPAAAQELAIQCGQLISGGNSSGAFIAAELHVDDQANNQQTKTKIAVTKGGIAKISESESANATYSGTQDYVGSDGQIAGTIYTENSTITKNGETYWLSDFMDMVSGRISATAGFFENVITEAVDNYSTPNGSGFGNIMSAIVTRIINGMDFDDAVGDVAILVMANSLAVEVYQSFITDADILLYRMQNYQTVGEMPTDQLRVKMLKDSIVPNLLVNLFVQAAVNGFEDLGAVGENVTVQTAISQGLKSIGMGSLGAGGLTAAIMVFAGTAFAGDPITEQTVGQATIAATSVVAAMLVAEALTGTALGAWMNGMVFFGVDPVTMILSALISYGLTQILSGTKITHDETISHKIEVQPDGSLRITGLRDAGSLLRTYGTTDDDYIGNDSADDSAGHDIIVGQAGKNEIYGRGGHDFIEGRAEADYIEAGTGNDHVEAGDGDDFVDGGAGDDRIYGQNGNDNLLGGAGNDIIYGGHGNDNIEGNDGDDELYGNSGNDTIAGGAGNDVIFGGTGNDILLGEDGDDQIDGGDGDDEIRGGNGEDILAGGAGNDDIRGGSGNDIIFGEAGVDVLYGEDGHDTLDGGLESDLLFSGIGNDTLHGGYGDDDLYGEIGNDLLVGGRGDDLLDGGDGNDLYLYSRFDGLDTIQDTDGLNTLKFGDLNAADITEMKRVGDDLVITFDALNGITVKDHFVASALEYIEFANGQGIQVPSMTYDGVTGDASYVLVAGQNVLATFAAQYTRYQQLVAPFSPGTALSIDWVTNNYDSNVIPDYYERELYNDVQVRMSQKATGFFGMKMRIRFYDYHETLLLGSGSSDRIVGMYWGETINGGANNDQLYGNMGDDTINGGIDHDLIFGGGGNDTLNGQNGHDKIFGGTGNDTIQGGEGNDTLSGEQGNDTIYGDEGDDFISGGDGNDVLSGGAGRDIIYGDAGNDTLNGDDGDDFLHGGAGNDTLNGGAGNDLLYGGEGTNILNGGDGDDIFIAGPGSNTITGGNGNDILVLSGGIADYNVAFDVSGAVTLTDLRPGTPDGVSILTSGVENVQFADQTVALWDIFPQIGNITIAQGKTYTGQLPILAGYTAALEEQAVNGTFTINAAGQFSYNAPAQFSGNTSFKYKLTSPDGITRISQVNVTVPTNGAGTGAFTLGAASNVSNYVYSYYGGYDDRFRTRMALLDGGGYVVIWSSSQDGSGAGVYGQRYDAAGAKVGSTFLINQTTGNDQHVADVEAMDGGGFMVAWSSYFQNGDGGYDVYMRMFDSSGTALGNESRVNTANALNQWAPRIVRLQNGEIMAVWSGQQGGGDTFRVWARRYTSAGVQSGSEFEVSTASGGQYNPQVEALSDGGYIVVWEDIIGTDGGGSGVYARRYNAAGSAVGSVFRVNSTTTNNQQEAQVAALSNGGFVVVWSSNAQDGSGWGVYGQRYDAAGTTVGGEFLINTTTANDQRMPDVIGLADGGFYVTWSSFGQDGSGYGVYGQRFTSAGVKVDGENRLNDVVANNQFLPSLLELPNGNVVATWQSYENASQLQVLTRTLQAPAPGGFNIIGTTSSDIMVGTDAVDTLSGGLGDDDFRGNGGNDIMDGGAGTDTAHFTGNLANYTILITDGLANVQDTRVGTPDGTDALSNIEKLAFADQTIDLTAMFPDIDDMIIVQGQSYSGQIDIGAGYTTTVEQAPTAGALSLGANGAYTFASPANYVGDISFKVRTTAPSGVASIQTVVVKVPTPQLGTSPYNGQTEFQAGTYVFGNLGGDVIERQGVKTATLTGGGYVAIWSSYGQDGSAYGVYGQRFDANDNKVGGAFLINQTTAAHQYMADVIALQDGGFLVSWSHAPGDVHDVYMRRFSSAGTAATNEVRVNSYTGLHQNYMKFVQMANGNIFAVWNTQQGGASDFSIYGRVVTPDGDPVTAEIKINAYDTGHQYKPSIALLSNGNLIVAWEDWNGQDGSGYGVYGQIIDSQGSKVGSEFRLSTATAGNQSDVTVVRLSSGGFVAVWTSYGQDSSIDGVFGQVFDASGTKVGTEFQANTFTGNAQNMSDVIAIADGGFVVTWQSQAQDGSGWGVYGQRLNANGVKVGSEFIVNQLTTSDQVAPDVIALPNNDLVFVWQSWVNPTTQEIKARRFTAPSNGTYTLVGDISSNILVGGTLNDIINGSTYDDILVGGAGNDQIDGGAGNDIAFYSGNFAHYTVSYSGNTLTVQDTRGGTPDGTDTLTNIEVLRFADQNVNLSGLFPTLGKMKITPGQDYNGYFDLPAGYTVTITGAPSAGSLVLNPDNSFTYTAPTGFAGDTTFQYRIVAANGISRTATANVTILPVATGQGSYTLGAEQSVAAVSIINGTWDQYYMRERSQVSYLAGGGYVLAWTKADTDGSGQNVYYQTFDASGTSLMAPARAHTTVTAEQFQVHATPLVDGGFVLSWVDMSQNSVVWRRYNASGTAQTAEVKVMPTPTTGGYWDTSGTQVTQLANGNIAVVWNGRMGQNDYDVYLSLYDTAGASLGSPVKLNTTTSTSGHQQMARTERLTNGNLAVVWMDDNANDGSGFGIFMRVVTPTGTFATSEILVNTTTTGEQTTPALATLAGGGFVVSWVSYGQDGSLWGVYAQRFDAAGTKQGGEFLVNTFTANSQLYPSVTSLADGGFFIAWQSVAQDASGSGIYGKRFDGSGNSVGAEIQLHTTTTNDQDLPDITELANGDLLLTWRSMHSGVQVMQRRLVAPVGSGGYTLEAPVGEAAILVGGGGDDTLIGSTGNDELIGGLGNDILSGGSGDDTYRFNTGNGHDTINNQDAVGTDRLRLGAGIEAFDVWFQQNGYDLDVSLLGSSDRITLQNWFVNDAQKVDEIVLDDGTTLDKSKVTQLVGAMASFNPQALGPITALADLPQNVQNVIAANWV